MKYLLSLLVILLLFSCDKKKLRAPIEPTTTQVLHLAHTRSDFEGVIPSVLLSVPYQDYDVLCLGGDIDLFTSNDRNTMQVWDTLFNFSSPSTLWSVGNHDISNRSLIEEFTGRPTFYSWSKDDLSFLVLDTEIDRNDIVGEQLEMVREVVDTLSTAKYLFVLTHKLIWMYGNPDLEDQIEQVSNGGLGGCNYCVTPNNFYEDVYPELLKLEDRGIEVICVAGDLGFKVKEFSYLSPEGVQFLASGVDHRDDDNVAIVFDYLVTDTVSMGWRFELLENL